MVKFARGFTLVELIAVMIIVGVLSVTLFSRMTSLNSANVRASRDDIIAALFFAQQAAMARSGIQVVVASNQVDVKENGTSLKIDKSAYPLTLAHGVSATPFTFNYDKLGRTTAGTVSLTGPSGVSALITVEASGYAH